MTSPRTLIYTYNNYEGPKCGVVECLTSVARLQIWTIHQQKAEIMAVKMQKTDFEFVNPLKSNLYVRGLKIDEISWQNLTFSKMSKFSAKRHESLKRLANWTFLLFRMVIKTHLTRKTSISVSMNGNIWLGRQESAWVSMNGTIWRGFKRHQEDGEPYNKCVNVEG